MPTDIERKRKYMREWSRARKKDPAYAEARRVYLREYMRRRYREEPSFRDKSLASSKKSYNARYHTDPTYRKNKDRKRVLSRYGLTLEQYDEILDRQGNGCAICSAKHHDSRRSRLAVDHCHDTGRVRGLLCANCNTMIGHARDSVDIMLAGIAYLRAHEDGK